MPGHDVVVIGASAGGVEALKELVRYLPRDLPAAVFVVLHIPPHTPSALPMILDRQGQLTVRQAHPVEKIRLRSIYVAAPDHHLLIADDHVRQVRGPKENGHRPAIDPLFRSAAQAYGPRVIGVVLTGALSDGTAGLKVVKARGGIAVVQDPDDALYSSMPRNAVDNVAVDYVVKLHEIPGLLERLVCEPVAAQVLIESETLIQEVDVVDVSTAMVRKKEPIGVPSSYTCPDCGGVLWEIHDGDISRYRCRTGHAWSFEGLMARQVDTLEETLWTAVRVLEENSSLAARMSAKMHARGFDLAAQRFEQHSTQALQRASVIRTVLSTQPRTESTGQNVEASAVDVDKTG